MGVAFPPVVREHFATAVQSPPGAKVKVTGVNGAVPVLELLGIKGSRTDVLTVQKWVAEDVPGKRLLPVAVSGTGDCFCVDLDSEKNGVFFLDHETGKLSKAAASLAQFLSKLRPAGKSRVYPPLAQTKRRPKAIRFGDVYALRVGKWIKYFRVYENGYLGIYSWLSSEVETVTRVNGDWNGIGNFFKPPWKWHDDLEFVYIGRAAKHREHTRLPDVSWRRSVRSKNALIELIRRNHGY